MRVAVTGAGGALGRVLRPRLLARGATLASTDLRTPESVGDEVFAGDLREDAAVDAVLEGADAVLHLAGSSVEKPLLEIIQNNLVALQRVYEGARRHQVKRVIFASSNHAIGMYPAGHRLKLSDPFRPDGNYGLSKMWGEGLASLYFDKFGIETMAMRIGSAIERPLEPRHLSTWLGFEDLEQLVWRGLSVPGIGFQPVWGVSANSRAWWDNGEAAVLGYAPVQNAEEWAEEILRGADPGWQYQGGSFALADVR